MTTEVHKTTRIKPAGLVANAMETEHFWERLAKWTVIGALALSLPVAMYGWWNGPSSDDGSETADTISTTTHVSGRAMAVGPCDGVKRRHHFGTMPGKPINPAGQCGPDLWHDGHCVWTKTADGTVSPTPHCGGKLPDDVEYAWSAGEPFDGFVLLGPPRYNF